MYIKQKIKILLKRYISKSDFDLFDVIIYDEHTIQVSFVDSEDRQFKVYYDRLSDKRVYTLVSAGLYQKDIKLIYKITKKLSTSKAQKIFLYELLKHKGELKNEYQN